MIIKIPENFISERTYIIELFFKEIFGFDIDIKTYAGRDYEIILDNRNKLIIEDHFFSGMKEEGFVYEEKLIPREIKLVSNAFTIENDMPAIFGNDKIDVTHTEIVCGLDIFASAFFMLTRWEEYASDKKDMHGRFPAAASLAYKNGFLNRPIVNEYAEHLYNMLVHLKLNSRRKQRFFTAIPTHDVDQPLWSSRSILKRTIRDAVSKKRISYLIDNIKLHVKSKTDLSADPYNTFDYLMSMSEKYGVKSHFFFQSAKKCEYDNGYDMSKPFFISLIKRIYDRGHVAGFHPGCHTCNDSEKWKAEYRRLCVIAHNEVFCGRQHYLRFENPVTWQIWEDNGMKWDSTMTYHDREGFRCGICHEFTVFNIITRRKLLLKEKPLIVMEGSFFQYQELHYTDIISKIKDLKETVKKYNGEFVFLWHNSSFNVSGYENNRVIYEEILK